MLTADLERQNSSEVSIDASLEQALLRVLQLAQDQFDAGQYEHAIDYLKMILDGNPHDPNSNHLLVKILIALHDYENALPYIEVCLQNSPQNAAYWDTYLELLGFFNNPDVLAQAIALKADALQESEDSEKKTSVTAASMDILMPSTKLPVELQRLMAIKSSNKKHAKKTEDTAFRQLVALCEAKQYAELEKYAQHLISEAILAGFAWRFLGVMFLDLKLLAQAKQVMEKSISLLPHDATAHFNYALACAELKELDIAERFYRKAIELDRNFTAAYNNLGNLLKNSRKFDEAELILRKLVKLNPRSEIARLNLVSVMAKKEPLTDAIEVALEAVQLFPKSADLHNALGSIYFLLKRNEDALSHLLESIALNPEFGDAYSNIGSVYFDQKKYSLAKPYLERAVFLSPELGIAHCCLGQIYREYDNDIKKAILSMRKALECDPMNHIANTSLLFMLSENDVLSPEALFQEHQLFGLRAESPWKANWQSHSNSRDKKRVLNIGFVSADFYNHAVATFASPILSELAKRSELRLFAYSGTKIEDEITRKIRGYFHQWRDIKKMSDDLAYATIKEDQIDILFDLSGHTSYNRLPLFARKPAPLAITWIGYPGTTGLTAIDYYFTDKFFLSAREFDQIFTEKHIRLPASAPFINFEGAPEVNSLPAIENGYITFGSFNRIEKLSDDVIKVWCNLLKKVEGSKLLLASLPADGGFQGIIDKFLENDVPVERLILFGRCKMELYLQQLNRVDICLDTFPYNGGTTTLHSLWMGVPVISISGNTVASRTGTSALGHVGLQRLATKSKEEFVQEGVYWSQHLQELSTIRRDLRLRLQQSAIMNTKLISDHVASSLRKIWVRWCDGEQASSFDSEL